MNWDLIIVFIAVTIGVSCVGLSIYLVSRLRGLLPKASLTPKAAISVTQSATAGQPRTTTCLAISKDSIRHTTGAYSAGFTVKVPATMLSKAETVNEYYQKFERILTEEKPPGTVIQMRWTNHLENGSRLINETKPESLDGIYFPARILQEDATRHLWSRLVNFGFRSPKLSVWIKVPVKHDSDDSNNGVGLFLRQVKDSFRVSSIKDVFNIFKIFSSQSNSGIIRRSLKEQTECEEQADKVFAKIENNFPLPLKRLKNKELWDALYLGHNEKERKVPAFPAHNDTRFVDLRPFLNQDNIRFGSNYVLHGDTPAAVISMSLPPSPYSYNGVLSQITQNPKFRFRYSVLVEFIHLGKQKSLKKINSSIFWNSKNPIKSPERQNALESLHDVRHELASPNVMMVSARVTVVVYANPVANQLQLDIQLKELDRNCEKILSGFGEINGANAIREDGDVLVQLYKKTLIAEFDKQETGFEIDELAPQTATFAPLQGAWQGYENPHTILENASGELFGLNLLQSKENVSALAVVLGTTGSGKSVLVGKILKDILGSRPFASIALMDFGENFAPLVEVLGGRQFRFVPEEEKSINIWDYAGLEAGEKPTESQISLVCGDLLINAGIGRNNPDYSLYSAICENLVRLVYENVTAQNGDGLEKREPTLSDFLDSLDSFPFEEAMQPYQTRLAMLLNRYRGNVWLDAPTHADFLENSESRFDVYELDSLENFQPEIQASLAYRIASKIISTMGKAENGKFHPKIQVFDEMHKVKDKYPVILEAITRGARMGRKTNTLTILATQAYEDLSDLHGLTSNAGAFLIGKQNYNIDKLAEHANLPERAVNAVKNISNKVGEYSQFVFCLGSGIDQKIEIGFLQLSSLELWSLTSNPIERNARYQAAYLMPNEPMINVCGVLAAKYPRGLASANKEFLDESFLEQLYLNAKSAGYVFNEPDEVDSEENLDADEIVVFDDDTDNYQESDVAEESEDPQMEESALLM